ncbi:MAG: hypothetical protein EA420_08995 [Candidatus Competibacteraceae bacterium]|nr:MAG: hypothetical protein EA420_08995 [Candidatus Competibacteraceae bacterium]
MTAAAAREPLDTLEDLYHHLRAERRSNPGPPVRSRATSDLFLRPTGEQGWFTLVRGSLLHGDPFAQGTLADAEFRHLGDLPTEIPGQGYFRLSLAILRWLARTFPRETPAMDRESWLRGEGRPAALRDLAKASPLPAGAAVDLARFLLREPEADPERPPAPDTREIALPIALWSPNQETMGRIAMLRLWASAAWLPQDTGRPYPGLPSAFLATSPKFQDALNDAWAFAARESPALADLDVRWTLQVAPHATTLRQASVDGASAGAAFAAALLQLAPS